MQSFSSALHCEKISFLFDAKLWKTRAKNTACLLLVLKSMLEHRRSCFHVEPLACRHGCCLNRCHNPLCSLALALFEQEVAACSAWCFGKEWVGRCELELHCVVMCWFLHTKVLGCPAVSSETCWGSCDQTDVFSVALIARVEQLQRNGLQTCVGHFLSSTFQLCLRLSSCKALIMDIISKDVTLRCFFHS